MSSAQLPRPRTVSIARAMLYWLALTQSIMLVVNVYLLTSTYSHDALMEVYTSAGANTAIAGGMTSSFFRSYYVSLGLAVVLGIVYAVLARFVGKGRQGARVASWVIVGLFGICCTAAGVAVNTSGKAALSTLAGVNADTGLDLKIAAQNFTALAPDWVPPTQLALGTSSILASIITVVMLALPASHRYFRQPPEWATLLHSHSWETP